MTRPQGMPVAVFLTLAAMLVVAGLVGVLRPAAEAAQATALANEATAAQY